MRKVCLAVCLLLVASVAMAENSLVEDHVVAAVVQEVDAVTALADEANCSFEVTDPINFGEVGKVSFLSSEGESNRCFCSAFADCDNYSNRSCSDSSDPCQCSSQDRNCSIGRRGYVQCNGVRTYCGPVCQSPTCDPTCSGRSCSSHSDCDNGDCPQGFCTLTGVCMCVS